MRRPIKILRNMNYEWPNIVVPELPTGRVSEIGEDNVGRAETLRSKTIVATFEKFLAEGRHGVFAVRDGITVGHAWVTPPAESRGVVNGYTRADLGESLIHYCYVDPSMRGRGIYAEMLHAVTAWSLGEGARVVRVDTGTKNIASQRGITRAGFLETGVRTSIVVGRQLVLETRARP